MKTKHDRLISDYDRTSQNLINLKKLTENHENTIIELKMLIEKKDEELAATHKQLKY